MSGATLRSRAAGRRLGVEILEARDVPAGNVTASVVSLGGVPTLQVIGESADNNVVLRGNGLGVIEVQGVSTKINGGTVKLNFAGVGRLSVDLGDGNDTADVRHNTASDSFSLDGGAGIDVLLALHNVSPSLLFENFEA